MVIWRRIRMGKAEANRRATEFRGSSGRVDGGLARSREPGRLPAATAARLRRDYRRLRADVDRHVDPGMRDWPRS
jgi:hypothetical protein